MEYILVFEGGGSRTRLTVYGDGAPLRHAESGPCNPFDIGVDRCVARMASLARELLRPDEHPSLACAGVAGAGTGLATAMGQGLCRALSLDRAIVTTDLYPVLLANAGTADAVLAVAGTGSSVMAQSASGAIEMAGGRGILFGDRGSAHAIAAAGLRAAAGAFDGLAPRTALVEALPGAVGVTKFNALVGWSRTATKADVAALCPIVTGLAVDDAVARTVVMDEARFHADVSLAGRRKVYAHPDCLIIAYGGVFDGCSLFFTAFTDRIRECGHSGPVQRAAITGTAAVVHLCRAQLHADWAVEVMRTAPDGAASSPTEAALASERTLDVMTAQEIVETMNREDGHAVHAVHQAAGAIAEAIEAAASAIQRGGRIIYVGAGTSGRLGVLDASECPPTFGVPSDRVVGVIAGGDRALRESVEGAEDDVDQGRRDMSALGLSARDFVLGIAASGTTPYTLAALDAARGAGCGTALLCCNPRATSGAAKIVTLDTGPEVVAGSTRLKAGTATKLALNMISTGAMALGGYVYHGLMVGVRPVNAKLWRRATGIVEVVAACSNEDAERQLREAGGHVPTAIVMARFQFSRPDAERRLRDCGGSLRAALDT